MLDGRFQRTLNSLETCKLKLEEQLKDLPKKESEDRRAYSFIEGFTERLESLMDELDYLSKDVKEGVLAEDTDEKRYYIEYTDGSKSYNLHCGYSLEIWDGEEWLYGSVEHRIDWDSKQQGYYFNGGAKPFLFDGMKVRKRQ